MEKHYTEAGETWFIFEEEHAVVFREKELALMRLHLWRKSRHKKHQPSSGPYFNLPTLRRDALADCVKNATFPVELRFSGKRVGGTRLYSGYGAADMGSQSRSITDLTCRLDLDQDQLWLKLWMRASPLHTIGKEQADQSDLPETRYELPIPLGEVPLVLDLRPSEERAFRKRLEQPS